MLDLRKRDDQVQKPNQNDLNQEALKLLEQQVDVGASNTANSINMDGQQRETSCPEIKCDSTSYRGNTMAKGKDVTRTRIGVSEGAGDVTARKLAKRRC